MEVWGALKGRMDIRLEAEWHDAAGQWHHSYGVQVSEYDPGLRAAALA